jgi:hypothetical protein
MIKLERFFPGLNHILCGKPPKSALAQLKEKLHKLRQSTLSELAGIFNDWIPVKSLESKTDLKSKTDLDSGVNSRERIYSQNVTFWAFLSQVLTPNTSCREVVRKLQSFCSENKLNLPSPNTAAYCKARSRIALKDLKNIHDVVAQRLQNRVLHDQLWKGHDVKVVDGTGITLPDTVENQAEFPQPGEQSKGCGFPVMKLVACFSLASGALLRSVETSLKSSESRILKQFLDFFERDDVVLTDRGFCSYSNIALLVQRGVHAVMRVHQARKIDFRIGKRIGPYERLITWDKPARQKGWTREVLGGFAKSSAPAPRTCVYPRKAA